ncbi:MAG: peptidoglycan DD-metalloendopeptidase family protein [Bacteroidales bacterium]|nr:peptidoglycan DD-metalloendopeptidase family protein [Bacteroidales bacterium]
MRKAYIILILLALACPALAQLPGQQYRLVPYEIKRCTREIKIPIDTIHTDDKYVDIILFDNQTWEYLTYARPGIDSTAVYDDYFDYEALHARYPEGSIPAEVDLCLVDETHAFCVPFKGKVFSKFKMRRSRPHKGVDIPLDRGDTIRAAFDGVVRVSTGVRTGGYGNLIILRHSNGLETYYGHLSQRLVEAGEQVRAGEVIGLGGSTGRSSGPHLHFETRYKGQAFDPERIVDFERGELRAPTICLKKDYFSIYSHYGQTDKESKAASEAQYYKVRSGDTLGRIALKYGTTVNKICQLNGIKSTKILRIGETLRVR